jgi:uncharacterized protein (TIGR02594 family)
MMKMTIRAAIAAIALALPVVAAAPAQATPLIKLMEKDLGQRRPKGCPSKWCACYMDQILARAGFSSRGSNRARDFASYGKNTKTAKVGSIMVMRNHVGVVMGKCSNGQVKIISGNYSKKVAVGCYPASKAIAWRDPIKAR